MTLTPCRVICIWYKPQTYCMDSTSQRLRAVCAATARLLFSKLYTADFKILRIVNVIVARFLLLLASRPTSKRTHICAVNKKSRAVEGKLRDATVNFDQYGICAGILFPMFRLMLLVAVGISAALRPRLGFMTQKLKTKTKTKTQMLKTKTKTKTLTGKTKTKTKTKTLMLNSQNEDKGQGQIKRGIAVA